MDTCKVTGGGGQTDQLVTSVRFGRQEEWSTSSFQSKLMKIHKERDVLLSEIYRW